MTASSLPSEFSSLYKSWTGSVGYPRLFPLGLDFGRQIKVEAKMDFIQRGTNLRRARYNFRQPLEISMNRKLFYLGMVKICDGLVTTKSMSVTQALICLKIPRWRIVAGSWIAFLDKHGSSGSILKVERYLRCRVLLILSPGAVFAVLPYGFGQHVVQRQNIR